MTKTKKTPIPTTSSQKTGVDLEEMRKKQLERQNAKIRAALIAKKKKMPKARDMAMGDKNISYVGDPFKVDGKIFDPAKEFPKTYIRPKGTKNFMCGGEVRGTGAAIKGTKFKGVF
tara:strand:- start:312 stop:659 length:348 start_codon:yes stop_codon:yes gene_type:complete